jgi:hypothetical protein
MNNIWSADKVTSTSRRRISGEWTVPVQASQSVKPGKPSGVPAARGAHNPFASLAPAPSALAGDTGAETKHYEVPRELIEIARAKLASDVRSGTLTPLAPRPTPDIDGALRVYAASVSKVDSVAAISPVVDPASLHGSVEIVVELPPVVEPAVASVAQALGSTERPDFRPGLRWQAWLLGAGLSLALCYGAQLLLSVTP